MTPPPPLTIPFAIVKQYTLERDLPRPRAKDELHRLLPEAVATGRQQYRYRSRELGLDMVYRVDEEGAVVSLSVRLGGIKSRVAQERRQLARAPQTAQDPGGRPTTLPPRLAVLADAVGGVVALAELCELGRNTVHRWGREDPNLTQRVFLNLLARKFGVPLPFPRDVQFL